MTIDKKELESRLDKLHEELIEMDGELEEMKERNEKVIDVLDKFIKYLDANEEEGNHSVLDVD